MPSSPRGYIKSPTNELSNQSVKGSSDGLLPGNGHHGHSMEPRRRAVTGNDIVNANASTNGMQESPAATLTLRSLVSSKEAGVIIGKGGANVAAMREKSGVKAGVSKVVPGVHHRVLTVSGSLEGVAKVRSSKSSHALIRKLTMISLVGLLTYRIYFARQSSSAWPYHQWFQRQCRRSSDYPTAHLSYIDGHRYWTPGSQD